MKEMKWVRCTWSREILVNAHDSSEEDILIEHPCIHVKTFFPHLNRITESGNKTWHGAFLLHLRFEHFQIYTYIYINGTLSCFQKVKRSWLVFTFNVLSLHQQLSPPLQQMYLMERNKASSLMLYIYMHLLTHTSILAIPQDPDKRALF